MREVSGKTIRAVLAAALLLLLTACGNGDGDAPTPRAVLVGHPDTAPGAQAQAYAGEVRAREEAALSFRVGGKLVRRLVDVGDRVARGQLLAELDPGDLRLQAQAAQAQLNAAQAQLARAEADLSRYRALAAQDLVSRSALDAQEAAFAAAQGQVRAARANLDVARNQAGYSRLLAPADGVVAARHAEAGQVVAAGQPVFTFAADGTREIAIALPESGLDDFRVGQVAEVELWSAPGQRIPGRIREISPAADPLTRTFAARVALPGATAVELGQSARVFFAPADSKGEGRLTVPLAALQRGGDGGTAVWVVDPDTRKLRLAPVKVGAYGEDRVPVLSGLRTSDWIVVAGGHLLREGEVVAPVDRNNRPVLEPVQPER